MEGMYLAERRACAAAASGVRVKSKLEFFPAIQDLQHREARRVHLLDNQQGFLLHIKRFFPRILLAKSCK
jgi:hypothetical protein